jgi:hypothetical protein
MIKPFLAGVALACTMAGPVHEASAQSPDTPMGAIEQLFAGMRSADPDMVRAVLAADARFAVINSRQGPATIQARTMDGWVSGIGESGGSWDEQIYQVEVNVDGDMASAWTPYTFYLDGEISHCGINSIELLQDADGWKITQLSDTRRQDDCPDPHGGA